MKDNPQDRKFSSAEKAALMLVSLGKETAAQVMKHLSESEAKRLSRLLLSVHEVPREEQLAVLTEFQRLLSASDKVLVDGKEFARELIGETFGQEAVAELTEFGSGSSSESLQYMLEDIPEQVLREVVVREHPQTVAFLLSQLSPDKGAQILSSLGDDDQTETLLRISRLAGVSEAIATEVKEVLRQEIGNARKNTADIGGKKVAAELLSRLGRKNEERLLSEIEEMHPTLADEVRELMFTFDDLKRLDAKSIQLILKEVPRDQLVLSFKLAGQEVQDLFLSNVTSRAAEMIREELESLPPVKKADVERAQRGIIDIVRRLEAEGKISLLGGEEDDWV